MDYILTTEHLIIRINAAYGLAVDQLTFLPLGADQNTAVYRAGTASGTADFVKLRRGHFDDII